jgi:hypothetical protein
MIMHGKMDRIQRTATVTCFAVAEVRNVYHLRCWNKEYVMDYDKQNKCLTLEPGSVCRQLELTCSVFNLKIVSAVQAETSEHLQRTTESQVTFGLLKRLVAGFPWWRPELVKSCDICGEQSGAGAGFLRVLRFPLPIFIPPIAPQSPSSIINRPVMTAVPSALSHPAKNNKKYV